MDLKKAMARLGFADSEYTIWDNKITMIPQMETRVVSPAEYDDEGQLLFEAETEEVDVAKAKPSDEQLAAAYEEVQLQESDIAMLISAYLGGKERDLENDNFNIVDGIIYGWSFKNVPKPTNAELISFIPALLQKKNQDQINKEALEYLAATDFYVIRMMDVGLPMPEGMQILRQQARDKIVRS